MAPKAFAPARVLEAISQLFAPGASSESRRSADRFLGEFQRSDACVQVAFHLLAAQDASHRLPPEAVLLLATAARRRLQRGVVAEANPPSPEETLKLAVLLAGLEPRAAELLVHAAAAQWLHSGNVPAEALLQASQGQGTEAVVALAALAALPEEANAPEVKLSSDVRATCLLELLSVAPRVLAALGATAAHAPGSRLATAAKWCLQCELSGEVVSLLAASPLLPLAGEAIARGPPDSTHGMELLETLLDRSGCADPCPEQLIEALLRVLSGVQPTAESERSMLCSLVASAANSWCRFFITGEEKPPAPAWVGLLEALAACSAWGHSAASSTLSTWLSVKEQATKVGAGAVYQPVLASAVKALRSAAVYPASYAAMDAESRDDFVQYRRELRDALRALMSEAPVRQAFLEDLRTEIAGRLSGPWEPLEEAVHALSTPAAAVCRGAGGDASNTASAAAVLETLSALAADGSPVLAASCHRQLACTFVMCASVYAAIFHFAAPLASGASLTARVLALARGTLGVKEQPAESEGVDSIFPFTVKQDHIGVVCLLRLCNSCHADPTLSSQETLAGLCGDVRAHVAAGVAGRGTLEEHSTVVLAEAVGSLAAHHAAAARELLAACMEMVADASSGGAALPLLAAAEVLLKCGRPQAEALGPALTASWPVLADPRLQPTALARLLAVAADHAPLECLQPLAQSLAGLLKSRPAHRAHFLKAAAAFVQRAGRENGAVSPLAAELLAGISALAWAEAEQGGAVSARLRLAADEESRLLEEEESGPAAALEVPAAERALIEAWAGLMQDAARHAPLVLASANTGLAQALTAACSLVAVPAREPPASACALLAHDWKACQVGAALCRESLGSSVAIGAEAWPLGALVLRAVMKALLGQMPPHALGVLMPAARAMFQHDAASSEAWLVRALAGDNFPAPGVKLQSKERLVKELLGCHSDAQKFKQALKKFCACRKKG